MSAVGRFVAGVLVAVLMSALVAAFALLIFAEFGPSPVRGEALVELRRVEPARWRREVERALRYLFRDTRYDDVDLAHHLEVPIGVVRDWRAEEPAMFAEYVEA